jgi:D-sedoheptulose 7-phosphate isomerase
MMESISEVVLVEELKTDHSSHEEYIKNYLNEVVDITRTINRNEIKKAIEILFDAWKNDNQVFVFGNGGSASTATHFAADLSKTTIIKGKKRFKGISLFDNVPLVTAWINDEGWENVYRGQLENLFQPGDVAIAISVHGGKGRGNATEWSQNLTRALQYAKDNRGKCIGISGFDGGSFNELCDASIIVPKNSTPLVEGFHGDITHLIIFRLKELIARY